MSYKYLKIISRWIVNFFKLYSINNKYIYKIEEINLCSNRIVLSCRGKGATIITTISEIGYDEHLINYLPPHQACWIGYYFGLAWSIDKNSNKNKYNTELKQPTPIDSHYKIICQNRYGEIFYQNTNNGTIYKMEPIELAQSKTISLFDSSQAFYVGFIAALKQQKNTNKNSNNQKTSKPFLRLIKK